MASVDRACRRAREEFDVYLDGEASPRRVRMIEEHLAACEACRRVLAQRRREHATIGDLPLHTAPDDFTEPVMAGLADRPTPTARSTARLRPRLVYSTAGAVLAGLGLWVWAVLRAPEAPSPVRPREVVREEMPTGPPVVHEPEQPPQQMEVGRGETSKSRRTPKRRPPAPPREERPAREPEPVPEMIAEPDDPIAIADYRQLGEAYEREGMLEDALEAYEVAAEEDESPLVTIALARVQERMGDTVSAIDMYAEAAFADFDLIPYEEG